VQLRWPTYVGGANSPSLVEAQANYAAFGAKDRRSWRFTRRPNASEPLEVGFRPICLESDNFEASGDQSEPWPQDRSVLYWWRPTYWRRSAD
jgi:hypothetical protein